MRVLVVGGAGYIGSVTSLHLLACGHEPVVLDNLSKGHRESVPRGIAFVNADFGNRRALDELLQAQPIDAVMHFGALSLVGESVKEPGKYFNNNVSKGLVLLDCLLEHGVQHFVFSSTAAVYGEPAATPIAEDFPLTPSNPYGDSKLAFEKILKWYAQAYDLKYTSLRYFNAAGATEDVGEDHHGETHLIPLVLKVALGQREHIAVYGDDYDTADGTCIRDYIHVSDLASAHVVALEHMIKSGNSQVFNLGNGIGFSVRQIIEAARKVTGHPIPEIVTPRRAGDPSILVASNEKIKKMLNWQPQYSDVEKIIGDAWRWHQKYPLGYEGAQTAKTESGKIETGSAKSGVSRAAEKCGAEESSVPNPTGSQ
jgi:UDP-glucose 4-epimerase